ncbi:thiaminase II/PqqC family protein [Curtobacterium sp. 24E2]
MVVRRQRRAAGHDRVRVPGRAARRVARRGRVRRVPRAGRALPAGLRAAPGRVGVERCRRWYWRCGCRRCGCRRCGCRRCGCRRCGCRRWSRSCGCGLLDGGVRGCAAEARDLHHRRLAGTHADDPVHPTCAGYLAHLQQAADSGSAAVLAAAVLPCFRVYAWVGAQLGSAPDGHAFADWITAYGDPGFAASSAEATRLVEEMAASATPAERGRMARAFRRSTEWELAFFEMPLAGAAGATVAAAEATLRR